MLHQLFMILTEKCTSKSMKPLQQITFSFGRFVFVKQKTMQRKNLFATCVLGFDIHVHRYITKTL